MKISIRYMAFLILVYFGVFWSIIQEHISIMGYWDELLAVSFFAIFLIKVKVFFIDRQKFINYMFAILFIISGIVGNVLYKNTSYNVMIFDIFLNIKFFLCVFSVEIIFNKFNFTRYLKRVEMHLDIISIVFILSFLIDRIFKVFNIYEYRFGIPSEQLFFLHPTYCASACFFLILLRVLFCRGYNVKNYILSAILAVIVCFTLRIKAIVTVIIFTMVFALSISDKLKKQKKKIILVTIVIALIASISQFKAYFTGYGLTHFPRGVLLLTSLVIARDRFPIGTGFGTFGSYMSGVYYSPVYRKYGIDNIYGLTKDNFNAMTDQYWPMVLGQTGVLGFVCMLGLWINVFRCVLLNIYDKKSKLAGLGCCIYILISSTSESAICNPACIPFAIILGFIFSENNGGIE